MWDAFVNLFVNILLVIYNLVGQNFGIAIILFTILIRLVTHPLTVQQMRGTQAMQKLQTDKRYLEMQKKYKDDKEKLYVEQQKLMKELGVNPFGACLPTLIQFPVIIALYNSITRAMAVAPLDLLNLTRSIYPGITDITKLIPLNSHFLWFDLGQPERLFIPGLGFGLPILVVIVVVTSYLQSKLMTPATNPNSNQNDPSAQMSQSMNLMMPVMMGFIAWTLPAGLAVYFITTNIVGVIQYALLGKVNWRALLPMRKESSAR